MKIPRGHQPLSSFIDRQMNFLSLKLSRMKEHDMFGNRAWRINQTYDDNRLRGLIWEDEIKSLYGRTK